MSLESRPRLKRAQTLGLKAAGVAMMPLGIYGMYHGSQIDEPVWQAKAEASQHHAEASDNAQKAETLTDTSKAKREAVIFTLAGLGTAMAGFGTLLEGIVKGRETKDSKGYIHHVHPWKASNVYVSGEPLTNDEKREITLPYRKTRFIK